MDASTNAAATTTTTTQSKPHHTNIFSPLPPPPTLTAAPPLLHWSTTNTTSNHCVFSSRSLNLPLPSRDFVSYPPTTATPKRPRPPRRKPDAAASASASTSIATPKTTPPCTECGKRFSSWKALFGHMRCHPERQWRGINPPPHFRRLSSPGAAQFSDEEYQVAASLVMLANGPPKDDNVIDMSVDGKVVLGWRQRRAGLSEGEEGAVHCEVGRKKAWVHTEAFGSDHNCNLCYKGFSGGQALGGHKRCHWERGEDRVGSSSSSAKNYVLDLNSPPPMESNESSPRPVVDLRLGI